MITGTKENREIAATRLDPLITLIHFLLRLMHAICINNHILIVCHLQKVHPQVSGISNIVLKKRHNVYYGCGTYMIIITH